MSPSNSKGTNGVRFLRVLDLPALSMDTSASVQLLADGIMNHGERGSASTRQSAKVSVHNAFPPTPDSSGHSGPSTALPPPLLPRNRHAVATCGSPAISTGTRTDDGVPSRRLTHLVASAHCRPRRGAHLHACFPYAFKNSNVEPRSDSASLFLLLLHPSPFLLHLSIYPHSISFLPFPSYRVFSSFPSYQTPPRQRSWLPE